MRRGNIIVLAKAPHPGFTKTRLCPPCTPEQAANLAAAALADTLDAVLLTDCQRRVLVFDQGLSPVAAQAAPWWRNGFEIIAQGPGGLAERLTQAFDDVGAPTFLVAMDTPQVSPALLSAGLDALSNHDASFGPADDGGYWGIGLARALGNVFAGVPMSEAHTGAAQLQRLRDLGLSVATLATLRDVDTADDVRVVAALAPHGKFGAEARATFGA